MNNIVRAVKTSVLVCSVAVLTACGGGGGGDGNDKWGAIATGYLEAGVSSGQATEADARLIALNQCGTNCTVREVFSGNQCGGTSFSTAPVVMAYAVGSSEADADNKAKLNCIAAGGTFCTVYRGSCN